MGAAAENRTDGVVGVYLLFSLFCRAVFLSVLSFRCFRHVSFPCRLSVSCSTLYFFTLVTQIGIILGVVIKFFVLEMMTSTFFSIFVKSNILVISIDIRIGLFVVTGIRLKPVSPYGHVASVLNLVN